MDAVQHSLDAPRDVTGPSHDLYCLLGIDENLHFPEDVLASLQEPSNVATHHYTGRSSSPCMVIHVRNPVPWAPSRREGIPLLPGRYNDTVESLAVAYGNVFRAFLATSETYTSLRLTSFFDVYPSGLIPSQIAGFSYTALDQAFRSLPSSSLQTLLRRLLTTE